MKEAEHTLLNHLAHLQALRKRLEPDHMARATVEGRIKETQEAIKAVRGEPNE